MPLRSGLAPLAFLALAAAAHAAIAAPRDFAPLAVGNRWVYGGYQQCAGVLMRNVRDDQVHRIITVDSSQALAGGTDFFLSYRDSLFGRRISGSGIATATLPDSVLAGRFRIFENPDVSFLLMTSSGTDYPPPEMRLFFKAHDFGAAAGDTIGMAWQLHKIADDSCAYAAGSGLVYLHHLYHVYNTDTFTSPYRDVGFHLVSFSGGSGPAAGAVFAPGKPALNFAPMAVGASWRWKGHHRRVSDSSGAAKEDSLDRFARVESIAQEEGGDNCLIAFRDSLYARRAGGAALADTVAAYEFKVTCNPDRPYISGFGLDWDKYDLQRFFNSMAYPQDRLEQMVLNSDAATVLIVRDGVPGLFADTLIYAQGVGFVSRVKWLTGIDGLTERVEYHLAEFNGAPFNASSALARPAVKGPARASGAGSFGLGRRFWSWKGLSLLGRKLFAAHD